MPAYVDACIALSLSLMHDYDTTSLKFDNTVQFQLQVRGLGSSGSPQEFANEAWNDNWPGRTAARCSVKTSIHAGTPNLGVRRRSPTCPGEATKNTRYHWGRGRS